MNYGASSLAMLHRLSSVFPRLIAEDVDTVDAIDGRWPVIDRVLALRCEVLGSMGPCILKDIRLGPIDGRVTYRLPCRPSSLNPAVSSKTKDARLLLVVAIELLLV
jgi:hypothetical protein